MGRHAVSMEGDRSAERSRRRRRACLVAGLLASSAVVWQSSHATFTASTSNDNNVFGSGTVSITDNDGGSAMFSVASLAPGDTGTVCMGVEYTGSLTPTGIKVYTSNAQEANNSGSYVAWANDNTSEVDGNLSMEIQVGNTDLGSNPGSSCAAESSFTDIAGGPPGTVMQTMINSNTSYATGLNSQWGTITANKWRVWKFTYTFSSSAPNTAQGDGLKVTFNWEAQR